MAQITVNADHNFGGVHKVKGLALAEASGEAVAFQQLSDYQLTTEKGVAGGYASLGLDGKVLTEELPPTGGIGQPYTHVQEIAQFSWVVVHNLGRKPFVDVRVGDEQIEARVTHPSINSALIEFNSAAAGVALCF